MHGFGGAPWHAKLLCQGTPDVGFDSVDNISLKGLSIGRKQDDAV